MNQDARRVLLERLRVLAEQSRDDAEIPHVEADEALLTYINDEEISEAYGSISRWFA